MVQGRDQGVAAWVGVAAQPHGGCQAEDINSGVVADAGGRGHKLVNANDGVVKLSRCPFPHRQTAFLSHHTHLIKHGFGLITQDMVAAG